MLLTSLGTSSKVKFSVSMLRFCSGGGISSELVVKLVLRSPLKYSAHSSSSSVNEVGGSQFPLFTGDGDVSELSLFSFLTMLKRSLVSFLLLAALASAHICSIFLSCHSRVMRLLVRQYFSMYCSFRN